MSRNVVIKNNKVEIAPNPSELQIRATGVIFLAEIHGFIYKAHKMPDSGKFKWIGMWNSICHTLESQNSLEALIKLTLLDGYAVKEFCKSDLIIPKF